MSNPADKVTTDMIQFFASTVDAFLQDTLNSYTNETPDINDMIIKSARLAQVGIIISNYFKANAELLMKALSDEEYNTVRIAALEATIPIAKMFNKKMIEWNEATKKPALAPKGAN